MTRDDPLSCSLHITYDEGLSPVMLVMVIPMLYAGMLLGGIPALEGLLVTLLLVAASFVGNILAGVIALRMMRKIK